MWWIVWFACGAKVSPSPEPPAGLTAEQRDVQRAAQAMAEAVVRQHGSRPPPPALAELVESVRALPGVAVVEAWEATATLHLHFEDGATALVVGDGRFSR